MKGHAGGGAAHEFQAVVERLSGAGLVHAHENEPGRDHRDGSRKEDRLFGNKPDGLSFLRPAVKLLIMDSQPVKGVHQAPGHKQGRKHGNHDTEGQRLGEAAHRSGTEEAQDGGRDQGGHIAVDDGGQGLLEADLHGRLHRLSGSDLFPDPGEDDHVRVHGHADGQDNAGHAGKGQGDVKAVQKEYHELHVQPQGKRACQAGDPVHRDHEDHDDRHADGSGEQALFNRLASQLRAYHVGTKLLQLQAQSPDADGGSQVLRFLKGSHARDHRLAVRDGIVYRRGADHLAVIDDVDDIVRGRRRLGGLRELLRPLLRHGQLDHRGLVSHGVGLIARLRVRDIRSVQHRVSCGILEDQ